MNVNRACLVKTHCSKIVPSFNLRRNYSAKQSKNYAVLIGGGIPGHTISRLFKKHLPEVAEYKDLKITQDNLIESKSFSVDTVSSFFANGTECKMARLNVDLFSIISNYRKKIPNIIPVKPLRTLKGANDRLTISKEFDRLSTLIDENDKLWIFLTGHGHRRWGLILWNEKLTTEFLDNFFLENQFKKLKPQIEIKVIVSSCYSGQYLDLSARNRTVLTTSIARKVSSYKDSEGCSQFKSFSKALLEQGIEANLLKNQAINLHTDENYYSRDSLTFYIDSQFEKYTGCRSIEKFIHKQLLRIYTPYTNFAFEAGVCTAIVVDPTGIASGFANSKIAYGISQISIPIIKALAAVLFKTQYQKLSQKVLKSKIYTNWFVRSDLRMIKKMKRIVPKIPPSDLHHFPQNDKLNAIMAKLYKLKQDTANDEVLSSYHYLYDKAKLFSTFATNEELQEFIAIATPLLGKEMARITNCKQ